MEGRKEGEGRWGGSWEGWKKTGLRVGGSSHFFRIISVSGVNVKSTRITPTDDPFGRVRAHNHLLS